MIAQPSQVKRSVDVALWLGLTLLVCSWATCALQPRTAVAGYPTGRHHAPAREVTPPAVPVDEHSATGSSVRWHAPGETVAIPDSVAMRLLVGPNAQTRPLPPAVRHRVERVASHVLPCWPDVIDDVVVLQHPKPSPRDGSPYRDNFMAGALALEKRDQDQPYSDANLAVRLYLFLPEELFDGAGLDTPLACSNLVPYAGAPLPETLGDFLDWTVAHELWHAVDVQRRLALLQREAGEDAAIFDAVLSDARAWSRLYDELVVGEWLGWENHGEAYLRGDELAPNATVMRGRTTYTLTHGVFTVAYADDAYAFRRTFTRRGHLPDEIRHLSDMGPLLNTGAVPTLYALFNDRDERFAEYGAWYTFSALVGEPDAFKALHPDLAAAYAARREAAARACSP